MFVEVLEVVTYCNIGLKAAQLPSDALRPFWNGKARQGKQGKPQYYKQMNRRGDAMELLPIPLNPTWSHVMSLWSCYLHSPTRHGLT